MVVQCIVFWSSIYNHLCFCSIWYYGTWFLQNDSGGLYSDGVGSGRNSCKREYLERLHFTFYKVKPFVLLCHHQPKYTPKPPFKADVCDCSPFPNVQQTYNFPVWSPGRVFGCLLWCERQIPHPLTAMSQVSDKLTLAAKKTSPHKKLEQKQHSPRVFRADRQQGTPFLKQKQ